MTEQPTTKVCTKCGVEKPLEEFYARGGRCKACQIADVVARKQAKRLAAAASVAHREGCRNPSECKSKGPGLCPPCNAAAVAAIPAVREARIKNVKSQGFREAAGKRLAALHRDTSFSQKHSARMSERMRDLQSDPIFIAARDKRAADNFTSDEARAASSLRMKAYHERRRDNEQFDAFMLRMEQEAAEADYDSGHN